MAKARERKNYFKGEGWKNACRKDERVKKKDNKETLQVN